MGHGLHSLQVLIAMRGAFHFFSLIGSLVLAIISLASLFPYIVQSSVSFYLFS